MLAAAVGKTVALGHVGAGKNEHGAQEEKGVEEDSRFLFYAMGRIAKKRHSNTSNSHTVKPNMRTCMYVAFASDVLDGRRKWSRE